MTLPQVADLLSLKGRVALVTGAAEGIGAEIARHLAGAGAAVAVLDRNAAGAEALAASLSLAGAEALAAPADLSDETEIVSAVDKVKSHFGRLDILVNNAGVQNREMLVDTSTELWDFIHRINARGQFIALREAAKVMKAGGRGGRIVNVSSMGSLHPVMGGLTAYNASKTAVNGLTRSAALELAPDRITVNAVAPGGVATPGAMSASGPPVAGRVLEPPILGRLCEASDIAAMVLFLASPAAEMVTGHVLAVDAGYLLG